MEEDGMRGPWQSRDAEWSAASASVQRSVSCHVGPSCCRSNVEGGAVVVLIPIIGHVAAAQPVAVAAAVLAAAAALDAQPFPPRPPALRTYRSTPQALHLHQPR